MDNIVFNFIRDVSVMVWQGLTWQSNYEGVIFAYSYLIYFLFSIGLMIYSYRNKERSLFKAGFFMCLFTFSFVPAIVMLALVTVGPIIWVGVMLDRLTNRITRKFPDR